MTPTVSNHRSQQKKGYLTTQVQALILGRQDQTMPTDGSVTSPLIPMLNPRFSETLMGIPPMWTSCEPLAMALYQAWLHSHLSNFYAVLQWRLAVGQSNAIEFIRELITTFKAKVVAVEDKACIESEEPVQIEKRIVHIECLKCGIKTHFPFYMVDATESEHYKETIARPRCPACRAGTTKVRVTEDEFVAKRSVHEERVAHVKTKAQASVNPRWSPALAKCIVRLRKRQEIEAMLQGRDVKSE
jgi:Zn finger protein HypA/HybF involved in hydrogenase expression